MTNTPDAKIHEPDIKSMVNKTLIYTREIFLKNEFINGRHVPDLVLKSITHSVINSV